MISYKAEKKVTLPGDFLSLNIWNKGALKCLHTPTARISNHFHMHQTDVCGASVLNTKLRKSEEIDITSAWVVSYN